MVYWSLPMACREDIFWRTDHKMGLNHTRRGAVRVPHFSLWHVPSAHPRLYMTAGCRGECALMSVAHSDGRTTYKVRGADNALAVTNNSQHDIV